MSARLTLKKVLVLDEKGLSDTKNVLNKGKHGCTV